MSVAVRRLWHRGSLTDFVATHELGWDIAMAALTVVYVILAFGEDASIGPQDFAVWGLALVFLSEFCARCYDSLDRGKYLRSHWLDLITAIPVPGIPGLRLIRLLRLLRFAKIGILIRNRLISRGWNDTHLIWPTLVLFWIASAIALYLVEHDAPGSNIASFPDAMTAAFLIAATLGFGRHGLPVTQDGQIIAAIIVFFALGLWGFASSNLTRLWLSARDERPTQAIEDLAREVRAIDDRVQELLDVLRGRRASATTKTGHAEADEALVLEPIASAIDPN